MCLSIETPNQSQGTFIRGAVGSPIKLIKLPSLPPVLQSRPHSQWQGQLYTVAIPGQGSVDSHMEEALWSVILRSIRGEVRELVRFIGFQVELMKILDWVEERFGKAPTADRIQQEFYLLGQDPVEKVQKSASHLDQCYRKLQAKFPCQKQLKDRLFFGIHQHLHDSMLFLYKQGQTMYESLLSATQEAETEQTESKVSARFKGASV